MYNHDHHDHHLEMGKKFLLGIVLNFIFVLVELFYGWSIDSISLLADAWHNISDVGGLIISWFAFQMATKKPTKNYTYGYSKGTILASLANCVLLFLAIFTMGREAMVRFENPQHPDGNVVMLVAGIGVVINTLTALLFMRNNELNNRAAFLHMAADALVSIVVVCGGLIMINGGPDWVDPLLGLGICLVILWGTFNLFKSTMRLSLDGVPEGLDIDSIVTELEHVNGVVSIENLHVWAISTTRNAFTATVSVNQVESGSIERIKNEIRSILKNYRVQHTTLEVEILESKN
jgi:cobalt-zinc-cadmium efflux system protein